VQRAPRIPKADIPGYGAGVEAAASAGHHSDLTINHSRVGISLSTHSEGSVTEKDFALAGQIDQIAVTLA
jgi:pterin-4a-carbinolamine dehydratase